MTGRPERVPSDSLVLVRVGFGLLAAVEAVRYFAHGWIDRYYVAPVFFFSYPGLGWVRPLPPPGMHLVFAALLAGGLLMAFGRLYRIAATTVVLCFAYAFLIDQTNYLNHFYLIILIGAHLAAAPRGGGEMPAAWLWVFRFLVALPYVFGGLAKLELDWLRGLPLELWLADSAPTAGLPGATRALLARSMAIAGVLFDLTAVPGLAWRRTRPVYLVLLVAFHLTNAVLFRIGIFPFLMLVLSTLFLPPDWPRRLPGWGRLRAWVCPPAPAAASPGRRLRTGWLVLFAGAQIVLPLRHLAYPGRASWTEEGHTFAWQMKLREKAGAALFFLRDPQTGASIPYDHQGLLTARQENQMAGRPAMLSAFARHVRDRERARIGHDVQVTALAWVSLNGRPPQLLVDPEVDLAAVAWDLRPARWVLPGP